MKSTFWQADSGGMFPHWMQTLLFYFIYNYFWIKQTYEWWFKSSWVLFLSRIVYVELHFILRRKVFQVWKHHYLYCLNISPHVSSSKCGLAISFLKILCWPFKTWICRFQGHSPISSCENKIKKNTTAGIYEISLKISLSLLVLFDALLAANKQAEMLLFSAECQQETPRSEGAGKPFQIPELPRWSLQSSELTNEHAASLWECVFLGGAKWSISYLSAAYLRAAESREAVTSAAGGIKSVPSDAQGFTGLVKIAFPTVEIKHRRMFSSQAVE